jgi:hypothetical protein
MSKIADPACRDEIIGSIPLEHLAQVNDIAGAWASFDVGGVNYGGEPADRHYRRRDRRPDRRLGIAAAWL